MTTWETRRWLFRSTNNCKVSFRGLYDRAYGEIGPASGESPWTALVVKSNRVARSTVNYRQWSAGTVHHILMAAVDSFTAGQRPGIAQRPVTASDTGR